MSGWVPRPCAGLIERINAFLREADMPPSVFGIAVARAPCLVSDLRNGRKAGASLVRRADCVMYQWRRDYEAGRVQRVGDRRFRERSAERSSI